MEFVLIVSLSIVIAVILFFSIRAKLVTGVKNLFGNFK